MKNNEELSAAQQAMDANFDLYFSISESLRADVSYILNMRADDEPVWRRTFIRTIVPLIDGLAYCYLRICFADPELDPCDRGKLDPDGRQSADDRVKIALKSIYCKLNISPQPDFSGTGWTNTKQLLDARHALMHPKSPESLVFSDADWGNIYGGATWVLGEFFRLPTLLGKKFSDGV